MSAAAWLERIQASGVQLAVRDGKLAHKAPVGVMTPERRAWIKEHEGELVALLTASEAPQPVDHAAASSSASRGPCFYCGEPVTRQNGLLNWFKQLVHHDCTGRWKEAAPRRAYPHRGEWLRRPEPG